MNKPNLKVFETVDNLLFSLADSFVEIGNEAVEDNGHFNVVLSGGSSPKKLYELLASPAYRNKLDWSKVHFFFGDERNVPANDPQNNALMARKALFEPLLVPEAHIHAIDTSLAPDKAAEAYMETIKKQFTKKPIHFDLILLGLGDDSHTASLFPYTTVLKEKEASVKSVFVDKLNTDRITLTAALINQAKRIAFLVYGKDKAAAVETIFGEVRDTEKYPAQLIRQDNQTSWFLDKDSASKIIG
ncbi:6-phosphogluconolactonase [Albibacterium bauzanense]|uniref:6-phosphogluconolactonase n=1 Tax=Albibacterium bauzanense TaxID=653929 RepID=A0A4R1LPK1_9SPHI|nr:6-phosphogluconolactonase [Albibacterium bauzanense]TCK80672.1 6-phosphogluconolactonase [Albibacterium bauzanense]